MLEFLLGYCLGRSENSEPEHPRYFREPKPRELTKEELGYGLDVLINDKSEFVRMTAQEKLNSTT